MIPGYRLETLHSPSPAGEVYKAREISSGRSCLIKIVSADGASSQQFLHDAKLAATLFHPNVADVFEAGTLKTGEVYVVSEHSTGPTLRSHLDEEGTPELLTSIEIIRQAAEGLHTIHLAGLIHRAVKPENIVLTTDPETGGSLVRIGNIDFGGLGERSIISNKFLIDSAIGSLRYFSPEQCTGEESQAQTDIYGLGIVFFEMLAGEPPFDAATAMALIQKHKNQSPPDIRVENFHLRMLVTHSLSESLQKQARLRQHSANTLARQLRHIEQLATHSSTPPPAVSVPQPPVVAKKAATAAASVDRNSPFGLFAVHDFEAEQQKTKPRRNVTADAGNGLSESVKVVKPVEVEAPVNLKTEIPKAASPKIEIPNAEIPKTEIPKVVKPRDPETSKPVSADVPRVEPAIADGPVAATQQLETAAHPQRRSRLKQSKKKLHAMAAKPVAVEEPVIERQQLEMAAELPPPRRSRLKQLKKKLHAIVPKSPVEQVEQPSIPVVETPAVEAAAVPTEDVAAPVREVVTKKLNRVFAKPPVEHVEQPSTPIVETPAVEALAEAPVPVREVVKKKLASMRAKLVIERREPPSISIVETPAVEAVEAPFADLAVPVIEVAAAPVRDPVPVSPQRVVTPVVDVPAQVVEPVAVPAEQIAPPVATNIEGLGAASAIAAASTKKVARKIEWDMPEDDIPSEDDVLAVLASEDVAGIPFTPAEPILEIPAARVEQVTETSTPVVRAEPVIDVPVLHLEPVATISNATPDAPALEAPSIPVREAKPADIPSTPVESPTRTETQPLVPARAELIATPPVRRMDAARPVESSSAPVVSADVPSVVAHPPKPVERPVVQKTSKVETPLVQAKPTVVPINASDRRDEKSAELILAQVPVQRTVPKAPPKKRPVRIPRVELVEQEEITEVRPPSRRITIAWDAPAVRRNYPFEVAPSRKLDNVSFYPTILGGSKDKPGTEVVAEMSEGIFSNYHIAPTSSNIRRAALLGIGVIALTSLLLFGNDSFTRYFQSWSSADTVAKKALPSKKPLGTASKTAPSAIQNQSAVPAVQKPVTETAAEIVTEKQPSSDTTTPKSVKNAEKPVVETEVAKDRRSTAPDTSSRNSDRTVMAKPSLAVSAPKPVEKAKPKPETEKKVTTKKPPREETASTFNYSRPRVVKDPKP